MSKLKPILVIGVIAVVAVALALRWGKTRNLILGAPAA